MSSRVAAAVVVVVVVVVADCWSGLHGSFGIHRHVTAWTLG